MKEKLVFLPLVALLILGGAGCGRQSQSDRVKLAYVTNGIDPFWNNAAAGVRAAAAEFDVDCEVLMPAKGIVDQKRIVETLLAQGIHGLAISPIDARNQIDLVNEACAQTIVITHDADAPDSNRLAFVGMDNYKAGRAAGRMVKEALPDGGNVMLFVGRLEQLNAQQRRQGIIDELLDRPMQSIHDLKSDPIGQALTGPKYTILGTRTDNFDLARAKNLAEDAITAYPDINCMVGLFAYNTPACLQAVREAGKVGQIKLVSFDEHEDVLRGIGDGQVHGTISQQPYLYGYHSVRILAGLVRGDKSVLPENDFLEIPIVEVRADNVGEFWAKLKELQGN